MANEDDPRTAAGMVASLSSYVASATLAVLGALAAIATFVIDKREHLGGFYALSGAAAVALIASIFVGGKGVYEIAENGAKGTWKTDTRRKKFAWQSGLALLGVILVGASILSGDKKQPTDNAELTRRVERLSNDVGNLRRANIALQARVRRLARERAQSP
jgi:hypothetical protein